METNVSDGQLIVRYLLGDLPEEDQARLEDRAFADREYLRSIEDAENDLIDDYVRGALSDPERRQFEGRFLASTERQQKVEFARALAQLVPATESETPPVTVPLRESLLAFLRGLNPALQFSMAAAALLLVFAGAWMFTVTRGLRTEIARLQAEQQQRQWREETLRQQAAGELARNAELAAQLERERAHSEDLTRQLERDQGNAGSPTASLFASLFLPPGIGRGSNKRPQLVIPAIPRAARLNVELERGDDYSSYRAELSTAQGQPVWTQAGLRPHISPAGRIIRLTIPANALNAGQYELALKGVTDARQTEDVRYYYFDVQRK